MKDARTVGALGKGIYTLAEAARLTGVPTRKIRRWVHGYRYGSRGRVLTSEPVWRSELPEISGAVEIGFLDLVTVRIVAKLMDREMTWPRLRKLIARTQSMFADTHPLVTRRFKTDGYTVFCKEAEESGDPVLIDLAKNQLTFEAVLLPYIEDLDFDDLRASRWWPLGRDRQVVIDPRRCFGRPIVARGGVPTEVLAATYAAEDSYDAVARWYEVTEESVRDAVEFEARWKRTRRAA